MTDYMEPANTNLSFSDVMTDKKRKLAVDSLGQTVYLLSQSGIPRDKIADALFSYVKEILIPKGGLTGDSATIWYAQLQRYRDELASHIKLIEDTLDGKHQ